jgi:superfamily II DNA or RNA helicase
MPSNKLKTYLSSRGYGILKTEDNKDLIDEIKRELTVTPKLMSSAPFMTNKEYPIFMESDNKIYIPKCYGLSKFGKPEVDNLSKGLDCPNLVFNGELRDIQKKPIEAYIKSVENPEKLGGIISVPCGFGKTIMSIYVACYFKKKTLFISHKNFLNEQFITSIKDFIPKVRIGKIRSDKIDIEDKDIVIATLQSLAMRDYDPKIFKDFGLVIIDECHHIASEIFSRAFRKMNIRITLGLSATLNRKDGLRKVFEWYLGNSVFNFKVDKNSCDMIVQVHKYFASATEYSAIKTFYNGQPNLVASINNICNYKPRTLLIIDILKSILKTDKDRKILILSERKNQLKTIEELIVEDNIGSYGYYIGGMKMSDLDISATKQIILATYQMSSEGLNIPTLNTLILASPIGDIQQSVGRILREKKEVRKYIPLCIDIFDELSIIKSKGYRRLKYYKSNGYIIKNYLENTYVNDFIYDESSSEDGKSNKKDIDLFINDEEQDEYQEKKEIKKKGKKIKKVDNNKLLASDEE